MSRIKYGMTELREQEELREYIPELFDGRGGNALYIGANQVRPPHHAGTLAQYGWELHLLEAFMGNVEFHGANKLWETIYLGNVLCVEQLPKRAFDVVFWWHGPEHVPFERLGVALDNIEDCAESLVVLGCPHGLQKQDSVYGNKLEAHLWDVEPCDLEAVGYNVVPYLAHPMRHLLAWRWMM